MDLPHTRTIVPSVEWLESVPSTNQHMRDLATGGVWDSETHLSGSPRVIAVVATSDQTAGRGRAGRGWQTPADTSVAASFLIRGFTGTDLGVGWLPLLAGSAVATALQPHFADQPGYRVGVKWPNDVHVRDEHDAAAGKPGLKLCGILCELLPGGDIVVGAGINLLIPEEELPTERSTSLLAAGAEVNGAATLREGAGAILLDDVLESVAAELNKLVQLAQTHPAALRARVLRHSLTLNTEVRVHLPGGELVDGRARALAADGSLVVDLPTGGELAVSAGDVEHLR